MNNKQLYKIIVMLSIVTLLSTTYGYIAHLKLQDMYENAMMDHQADFPRYDEQEYITNSGGAPLPREIMIMRAADELGNSIMSLNTALALSGGESGMKAMGAINLMYNYKQAMRKYVEDAYEDRDEFEYDIEIIMSDLLVIKQWLYERNKEHNVKVYTTEEFMLDIGDKLESKVVDESFVNRNFK